MCLKSAPETETCRWETLLSSRARMCVNVSLVRLGRSWVEDMIAGDLEDRETIDDIALGRCRINELAMIAVVCEFDCPLVSFLKEAENFSVSIV